MNDLHGALVCDPPGPGDTHVTRDTFHNHHLLLAAEHPRGLGQRDGFLWRTLSLHTSERRARAVWVIAEIGSRKHSTLPTKAVLSVGVGHVDLFDLLRTLPAHLLFTRGGGSRSGNGIDGNRRLGVSCPRSRTHPGNSYGSSDVRPVIAMEMETLLTLKRIHKLPRNR